MARRIKNKGYNENSDLAKQIKLSEKMMKMQLSGKEPDMRDKFELAKYEQETGLRVVSIDKSGVNLKQIRRK